VSGSRFSESVVEDAALSLRDALLPKLNSAQLPMKNARWLVETG